MLSSLKHSLNLVEIIRSVFPQCHECISVISLGIFGSFLMLRVPQGHFAQEREKGCPLAAAGSELPF